MYAGNWIYYRLHKQTLFNSSFLFTDYKISGYGYFTE